MPKVSVIVPVYNAEKYLPECVDSILAQTLRDIEIILVDDGSTDDSPVLCDNYAKKDPRIKVIHKANGEVSSARNMGLSIASGDYFAFVDSDDIIDKNSYFKLYQVAQTYNVPLVICSGYYFSRFYKNNIIPESQSVEILKSHEVIAGNYNHNIALLFILVWNKLFKRSFFQNIRFREDLYLCEDEEFSTRLYLPEYDLAFLPLSLYGYRKNETSLTYQPFSQKNCIILKVLKERVVLYREAHLDISSAKAAKNFLEVYINYFYRADSALHSEWVRKYQSDFLILFCMSRKVTTLKDKIRYCIFAMSPCLYKKFVL